MWESERGDSSFSPDRCQINVCCWKFLRDDHRAGAAVGKDFTKQGMSRSAAKNMGAVNAALQQLDNTLELGNHAAGCRAILNHRFRFGRCESRELAAGFVSLQVETIYVRQQNQLLSFQLRRDFCGDGVGIDVEYGPFSIGAKRRDHRQVSLIKQDG